MDELNISSTPSLWSLKSDLTATEHYWGHIASPQVKRTRPRYFLVLTLLLHASSRDFKH